MADPTQGSQLSSKKFYCDSRFPQYYTAFVVSLAVMNLGTVFSWSATAMPDISSDAEFEQLTSSQESWITSIVMVCSPAWTYISGSLEILKSIADLKL